MRQQDWKVGPINLVPWSNMFWGSDAPPGSKNTLFKPCLFIKVSEVSTQSLDFARWQLRTYFDRGKGVNPPIQHNHAKMCKLVVACVLLLGLASVVSAQGSKAKPAATSYPDWPGAIQAANSTAGANLSTLLAAVQATGGRCCSPAAVRCAPCAASFITPT